jgi:hypothetical protein
MGRIVFGLITAVLLSACPGKSTVPLDEEELREFQACGIPGDCIMVRNQPSTCDCAIGWPQGNLTAISKTALMDFYEQFESPEACPAIGCPELEQPFIDSGFQANRYQVDCSDNLCSLIAHESVGDTCTSTATCPSGHDCREPSTQQDSDDTFCFFIGGED